VPQYAELSNHIVVAVFAHLPRTAIAVSPFTDPISKTEKVMRRLIAAASRFVVLQSPLIAKASLFFLSIVSTSFQVQALPAGILHEPVCGPEDVLANAPIDMPDLNVRGSVDGNVSCLAAPWSSELAQARAYLVETATPGYTMGRQGPALAIGRLHPEFAIRLAGALREARESGLPSAGVFSAYRPPAFGIGGFSDKFNSLHSYGLAVDLTGIGGPGSSDARRWHAIAAKHGVICPYGSDNQAEWNHCQPTSTKIVLAQSELRETITADGPVDLEAMFEAGNAMLESPGSARDGAGKVRPVQLVRLVTEQDVRRSGKRDRDEDEDDRAERSSKRDKREDRAEREARREKREEREERAERAERNKRKARLASARRDKDDDDD
jgi:hypothetical protein